MNSSKRHQLFFCGVVTITSGPEQLTIRQSRGDQCACTQLSLSSMSVVFCVSFLFFSFLFFSSFLIHLPHSFDIIPGATLKGHQKKNIKRTSDALHNKRPYLAAFASRSAYPRKTPCQWNCRSAPPTYSCGESCSRVSQNHVRLLVKSTGWIQDHSLCF